MKDEQISELLETVSKSIDDGDYKAALDGLDEAIKQVGESFGNSTELEELKTKIAEIHELLL